MARIYMPRQRQDDKRWDMTVGSDEEQWVHPIGYCRGWREWTDADAARHHVSLSHLQAEQAPQLPFKDKFHTDGHATSSEAHACYRQYELDICLRFHDLVDEQRKCKACGVFTTHYAELGDSIPRRYFLCVEHATREQVAKLVDAGDRGA